jgi:hypothetical protein
MEAIMGAAKKTLITTAAFGGVTVTGPNSATSDPPAHWDGGHGWFIIQSIPTTFTNSGYVKVSLLPDLDRLWDNSTTGYLPNTVVPPPAGPIAGSMTIPELSAVNTSGVYHFYAPPGLLMATAVAPNTGDAVNNLFCYIWS